MGQPLILCVKNDEQGVHSKRVGQSPQGGRALSKICIRKS